MANDQHILKYTGNNEELFIRMSADNLKADAEIIVPETHTAIMLKDGELANTLSSGRYPVFETKKGLFGGVKKIADTSVDVIFMSKTAKLKVLWGTRTQFDFRDDYTGIPVKVGANGEFQVQINDPRKAFLELIGAQMQFTTEQLKERLSGRMMSKIDTAIATAMREKHLSYDNMSEHKNEIADSILPVLSKMFEEEYGLKMFSITIYKVLISDQDVRAIETERQRRKAVEEQRKADEEQRAREREEKLEEKKTAAELAAELERLDDKNFERSMRLRQLEKDDYEKYLEVIKIIGWKPEGGAPAAKAPEPNVTYCANCAAPIPGDSNFCPRCGTKKRGDDVLCPKCGSKVDKTSAFCPRCGQRMPKQ